MTNVDIVAKNSGRHSTIHRHEKKIGLCLKWRAGEDSNPRPQIRSFNLADLPAFFLMENTQ